MSALASVAYLLRCPHCRGPLQHDERTLACPAGHSFDVARQGYVNLLTHGQPKNADTPDMVAARERLLSAGHYRPITAAIADATGGRERILEVGAGTGHHLAAALPEGAVGIAADISVAAAKRAARAHSKVAAIVADTWAELPLKDASMDALLCVFAPRNADEFRRVLAPGGSLVVVVPNPGHLAKIRRHHGLLGIDDDKLEHLARDFGEPDRRERVAYKLDLDADGVRDLVGMGPNAFHRIDGEFDAAVVGVDVTVASWHGLRGAPLA